MNTAPEPDQVFRKSRWKTAFALLGCLGFVLAGLWLFTLPVEEYTSRTPPEFITKGMAIATVLFFGWIAAVSFADTIDPSRLILNSEGFRIEGPSHRALVGWDEIEDFFVEKIKLNNIIAYHLRSDLPNVTGARRTLRGQFEADPDTIVSALNRRLKRHRLACLSHAGTVDSSGRTDRF